MPATPHRDPPAAGSGRPLVDLVQKRRLAEGLTCYDEALRLQPDFPMAHLNLGASLHAQGKFHEATAEYREALRLKKDFPLAHYNLGVALAQKGQNPAHPPGSVSNPTGNTPNGPFAANGAKAVDASNAVVLGGALSGQSPTAPPQSPPTYQPGAQLNLSA